MTHEPWWLKRSQLAVAASLEDIPQNENGRLMPAEFPYKKVFDPVTQADTYELNMVWEAGTELIISVHARVAQKNTNKKGKEVLVEQRGAWCAGNGYPGKKWDKYFTDSIEKSLIIIIKK